MGAFAQWGTIQAHEDLYNDGINSAKYKSAMRDEVYPYSIKFSMTGGYETPNFVLIPRPAIGTEKDLANTGSLEYLSVTANTLSCNGSSRLENWQFSNTATVSDEACVTSTPTFGTTEVIKDESQFCNVVDVDGNIAVVETLASGTLTITTDLDLVDYINVNSESIKVSTDAQFATIKAVLIAPNSYTDHCTPTFSDACDAPVQNTAASSMFALGVGTETFSEVDASYADYPRVYPAETCNNIIFDVDGNPSHDTAIEAAHAYGFTVYKKLPNVNTNNASTKALKLQKFIEGYPATSSFTLLNFLNSTAASLYDSTHDADVNAPLGYTALLHKSAVWFKGDFAGETKAIVELGTMTPSYSDIFSGTTVRVSVYEDSATSSNISSYTKFITDLDNTNTNQFIELDKADFPTSDIFYIAVDTPIKARPIYKSVLTLTGSTGQSDITITTPLGSDTSEITTPAGTLGQLAIDFIGYNSADIHSATGAFIQAVGETICVWTDQPTYTVTVTHISGDLTATISADNEYLLSPPSGCLSIYQRDVLTTKTYSYTDLTFGKQESYDTTCTFSVPLLGDCDPVVHHLQKSTHVI
jgi:hypothetical protein